MATSRDELPRDIGHVVPQSARRGYKTFQEGEGVTVTLPGEATRAEVVEVLSHDFMKVRLMQVIMNPRTAAQYERGNIILVMRDVAPGVLTEIWRVLSREEQRQEIMKADLDAAKRAKAEAEEDERVDARRARILAQRAEAERERQRHEKTQEMPEPDTNNWSA